MDDNECPDFDEGSCCPSCDALIAGVGARCGCDSNFRYAQEVNDDLERCGEEGL